MLQFLFFNGFKINKNKISDNFLQKKKKKNTFIGYMKKQKPRAPKVFLRHRNDLQNNTKIRANKPKTPPIKHKAHNEKQKI